jgi:hypothetical protein
LDAVNGTRVPKTTVPATAEVFVLVAVTLVTQVTALAGPAVMTACRATTLALARRSRLVVEVNMRADGKPSENRF